MSSATLEVIWNFPSLTNARGRDVMDRKRLCSSLILFLLGSCSVTLLVNNLDVGIVGRSLWGREPMAGNYDDKVHDNGRAWGTCNLG